MYLCKCLFYICRYKYYFPFLETNGYININENRVEPLYKHVFLPALAPSLSFIGLPGMVSLNQNRYHSDFFLVHVLVGFNLLTVD